VTGFNATNVSSSGTPTTQQCDGSAGSGSYADDNGHGTHVAGTIAARDNGSGVVGVAPGARLAAVKVFDSSGNGYVSYIICGMDWIAAHANEIDAVNFSGAWSGTNTASCGAGTYTQVRVGWRSQYVYSEDTAHQAVCHLVNDLGIPMIVAAGNDGRNASNTLPAAYPEVISVGAIADSDGKPGGLGPSTGYGKDDTRASFSNYGSAVTIYAPGVNILSTWPIGNTNDGADGTSGLNTISGTSMATPHVTGAVALYLINHPGATPAQIKQALVSNGEAGNWGSPYGSQPLLNVNNAAFGPAVPTHSMSVNAISVTTSPAISGLANNVSVTITDSGNSNETGVSVTLTDGSSTVGTQGSLNFTAGQSQTLTFPWTPSGSGNHTLTATVTYNGGASANNSTTVNVEPFLVDVEISSVTAITTPIQGQTTTLRVHLSNTGNQPVSNVQVSLSANIGSGPTVIGSTQTLTGPFQPNTTADFDFSWTPSETGQYAINATVNYTGPGSNANSESNAFPITVVSQVHDVAVTNVSVPSSVTQGQSATVSVSVKNNGTTSESVLVSLTSSPNNGAGNPASRTVQLNAGQSTTVSFTWSTTTSTSTGSYSLTGHASISPETDATPADNDRTASNQITVNAPSTGSGWGWGGFGGGGWFWGGFGR
jgi:hypothetical protein